MIQVTVNGEKHALRPNSTVLDLVESLQLAGKRIAVEMDGEIVPKSQHANTPLIEGAQIEIVVAVGGG